jgi:hypothetical protein
MNNQTIRYADPYIKHNNIDKYEGTVKEKNILKKMFSEWNNRISDFDICKQWKKEKLVTEYEPLNILLFNIQCLSTHIPDLDILIAKFTPQICILTGVSIQIKKPPNIPFYNWICQEGTNSYGGVAMIIHNALKTKIILQVPNYILIELSILSESILIGAIYVPPKNYIPFNLLGNHLSKNFYIFGDFNAKHQQWMCSSNNTSGNELKCWLDEKGYQIIAPNKPTSKRSDAIIDFGITNDDTRWQSETINEGTSDHYPVHFVAPFSVSEKGYFKKTNWKLYHFFLQNIFEYLNVVVYNLDAEEFFYLFSLLLSSLSDRVSEYLPVAKYRPPWPPYLVALARKQNKQRTKYRKSRVLKDLEEYLFWKNIYTTEKCLYQQKQRENQTNWFSHGNNIWKLVRPIFHPYSPAFSGLTIDKDRIKNPQTIVDTLANHYEKHFESPMHDHRIPEHVEAIEEYQRISNLPNLSLEPISIEEVQAAWKRIQNKKSTDSDDISAFHLKQMPEEFLMIITIGFNRMAEAGSFLKRSKHAKVICISKEGMYPTPNKLRPISLLSNLGKIFEKIMHGRIMKWCKNKEIYVDEQSGFTPERRLQTRILTLVEDLRLTVAACNRPGLVIFVDFLSAFDRIWHPMLIKNLMKLECPLSIIRWIFSWLQERTMSIHYGNNVSRRIKISVGAPQGSVLAATLFRIHVHYLPQYFMNMAVHLFADDLAITISGSLEKKFSENIVEVEAQARIAMDILSKYSYEYILPVNIDKTKALLVHSVVAPPYPVITYRNVNIGFVNKFKYLGVEITTKLGWGEYIAHRIRRIRSIYNALSILFHRIPLSLIKLRRLLFFAFALPHFVWLFSCWFFYTDIQQQHIEHVYCSGLKIIYQLHKWEDITTYILSKELTLRDYLYKYWLKFNTHLEKSNEATHFQKTFTAYLIAKTPHKSWYLSMGLRKNNKFLKRLTERAKHTKIDLADFFLIQKEQYGYFKHSLSSIHLFAYKYYLLPP